MLGNVGSAIRLPTPLFCPGMWLAVTLPSHWSEVYEFQALTNARSLFSKWLISPAEVEIFADIRLRNGYSISDGTRTLLGSSP